MPKHKIILVQTRVVHLIYCLKLSNAARASFICQLTMCHRNSNLEQGYSARYSGMRNHQALLVHEPTIAGKSSWHRGYL
jgi:transposase-like protein